MLKEESTYPFLDILNIDDVPTNSNVVLILNQYKKAMNIFYKKYTAPDITGVKGKYNNDFYYVC